MKERDEKNINSMQVFRKLSRIKQALEESPKYKLGSGNKHIVDIDEIFNLLGDLEATIPDDIRKAGSIIASENAILHDAQEQAEETIAQAQQEAEHLGEMAQNEAQKVYDLAVKEYNALVAQESVYQEAVRRAEILEAEATDNANTIIMGARRYADDQLADVQRYLNGCIKTLNTNREELNVEPLPDNEPTLTVKQRAEKLEMPAPEKAAAKTRPEPAKRAVRPAPQMEEEDDDEELPVSSREPAGNIADDAEDTPKKKKKKNWFKRLLDGDDEEDEPDDMEEEIEPEEEEEEKPKKKRRGIFEIVDNDDEEENFDEEEE